MKREIYLDADRMDQKRDLYKEIALMRGKLKVTFEECRDTRSVRANRYWFGTIVDAFMQYNAAQGVNMTKEQAHATLKLEILPAKVFVSPVTGEVRAVPADTHTMTREQFSDLIEAGHAYMAELGVPLPDPHTYGGLHETRQARRAQGQEA